MSEFVVDVPPGLKPGDRFSAQVAHGMKVMIQVPPGAVAGQPLNIKLNPRGGDAIILDPTKHNIFMAICPKGKKPGDNFDVTDPRGTRMRVIVPHGVKPGQRFSVRGRGNSTVKTGHSALKAPAYAIHAETRSLGAVSSKSKIGFNYRWVYIREKNLREHSLYIKYSNNTRNLRVWLDGKQSIDTSLPPAGHIVHPIQMNHEGHKLVMKLLFNEVIEADFTIDGYEFDHLPQPDQTTSRQVCIPSAIALRKSKENVGKRIASSKVKYTWEIQFPGSHNRHLVVLTWSGKNVKVFLDRSQILAKSQASFHRSGTVFEHIFPCQGVECRVEIVRDEEETTPGADPITFGFHLGGISFDELPKSQHEYQQKHSKELVATLERARTGSTVSMPPPPAPERPNSPRAPGQSRKSAKSAKSATSDSRHPTEEQVKQLSGMGFSAAASRAALEAANCNMHKALDFLIANKKASDTLKPTTANADRTPSIPTAAAPAPAPAPAAADDDLLSDLFGDVAIAEPTPARVGAPVTSEASLSDLFSAAPAPALAPARQTNVAYDPFMEMAAGLVDGGEQPAQAPAADPFDPFAPAPVRAQAPAPAAAPVAALATQRASGFVPPALPASSASGNDPFAGLF